MPKFNSAHEVIAWLDTDQVACPICGRTDGEHDLTTAERKRLRRVKWQAFWNGFTLGLLYRDRPFLEPTFMEAGDEDS